MSPPLCVTLFYKKKRTEKLLDDFAFSLSIFLPLFYCPINHALSLIIALGALFSRSGELMVKGLFLLQYFLQHLTLHANVSTAFRDINVTKSNVSFTCKLEKRKNNVIFKLHSNEGYHGINWCLG